MVHYSSQPDAAFRDSLALERAHDDRSFSAVCAEIEARFAVEGASPETLELYEAEKQKHAARIASVLAA